MNNYKKEMRHWKNTINKLCEYVIDEPEAYSINNELRKVNEDSINYASKKFFSCRDKYLKTLNNNKGDRNE